MPYTSLLAFILRNYHIYFLEHQVLIIGKSVSQYASYSLIYSPLHSVINENSMKSISTINPAITENTECLIIEACTLVINLKVGVSLYHGVSLPFVLLPALGILWVTFQAKNNVKRALHLPKSHIEAITCVLQIITRERKKENKGKLW